MTASTRIFDLTGNQNMVDGNTMSWDAMTNTTIPVALRPVVCTGTGAPTFIAPKGSLYTRLDGGTNTAVYINNTGTGTWAAVTSA